MNVFIFSGISFPSLINLFTIKLNANHFPNLCSHFENLYKTFAKDATSKHFTFLIQWNSAKRVCHGNSPYVHMVSSKIIAKSVSGRFPNRLPRAVVMQVAKASLLETASLMVASLLLDQSSRLASAKSGLPSAVERTTTCSNRKPSLRNSVYTVVMQLLTSMDLSRPFL